MFFVKRVSVPQVRCQSGLSAMAVEVDVFLHKASGASRAEKQRRINIETQPHSAFIAFSAGSEF